MADSSLDHECVMVAVPAGKLDADALRESLDAFIERHEIWRTTFPRADDGTGRPVQVVQSEGQFTWSVLDLSDQSSAEAQAEALRRVQAEAREPFDLAGGPLVRALLVRFSPDEHRLYLTLHRIVADWVSLTGIFLPELQALYEARMERHAAICPRWNGSTRTTPTGSGTVPAPSGPSTCSSGRSTWPARPRRWSCGPTTGGRSSRSCGAECSHSS